MAQNLGYKSLYVSGGGVALMNLGVPDLGVTTLDDVLTDVRRLARVTEAPALVDIDTGLHDRYTILVYVAQGHASEPGTRASPCPSLHL